MAQRRRSRVHFVMSTPAALLFVNEIDTYHRLGRAWCMQERSLRPLPTRAYTPSFPPFRHTPPTLLYRCALKACGNLGDYQQANDILVRMAEESLTPDIVHWNHALRASAACARWQETRLRLQEMEVCEGKEQGVVGRFLRCKKDSEAIVSVTCEDVSRPSTLPERTCMQQKRSSKYPRCF